MKSSKFSGFPEKETILKRTFGIDLIPQIRIEHIGLLNKNCLVIGWLFWSIRITL